MPDRLGLRDLASFVPRAAAVRSCGTIDPAGYVRPCVKRQKNDCTYDEAVCEAVGRPNMRFVPTKTIEQRSGLLVHPTRSLLIRQQTSVLPFLACIRFWHASQSSSGIPLQRHVASARVPSRGVRAVVAKFGASEILGLRLAFCGG
jgi:hypothetical protein